MSICTNCKFFTGYDGVGELWTGCNLIGDFKGSKDNCRGFKKKVTKSDLYERIRELEKENAMLKVKLKEKEE